MTVRSTKGISIFLSNKNATLITKDGTGGGTTLTGIAANGTDSTKTDLTVDAITGIKVGDIVKMSDTGFPELDGKSFVVTAAATTKITINGDITGSTGTFDAAKAKAEFLPVSGQMTRLCLNSIGVNIDTPSSISTGTFCSPSASVPGAATSAGTLDLSVYHDPTDTGWKLLLEAEESGDQHTLIVQFPNSQGTLIATGTISAMSIADVPLEGAVNWSAQMTLSVKPEMRF